MVSMALTTVKVARNAVAIDSSALVQILMKTKPRLPMIENSVATITHSANGSLVGSHHTCGI